MATIAEIIAQKEAEVASKRALITAFATERAALIAPLAADASLSTEDQERFDKLTSDKRAAETALEPIEAKIVELRNEKDDDDKLTRAAAEKHQGAARIAPAVVTSEERTYNKGNKWQRSFFGDMYAAEYAGDYSARERLDQHRREAMVEGEMTQRAGTTTGFAGLVPPVYLPDDYALLARAGRPIANSVRHLDLPPEGMSIIIPRGTTGASAAIQASENATVSNTDEVWTNVTVPVVTIAGQQVVSRQSLERGQGIDDIIFADLYAAYNVALDAQVISGTGSSGQALGILNTSGVNQATAFGAAATASTYYLKGAGQLAAVETSRFMAPDVIFMHPRRWAWLVGQVDSQGRPLVVPNMNGPFNSLALGDIPKDTPASVPVGWQYGLPVITDASIPTNLGTGTLEDVVIVARWEDLYLWENGDGAPFQLRFEQTAGPNLSVTLVAYNYAAFTAGRYPAAVGLVGGNAGTSGFGLTTPSF